MLDTPRVTPKISDRPVREPASEWASSTLDALEPISPVGDQVASNVTTPGLQVPGAFPDPHPTFIVHQDIQYVKDVAIGALRSTQGYVPMSMEDVKRLIENAGDTVGGYLPQSVAAYLPHPTTGDTSSVSIARHTTNASLPSEEISQNVHPDSSDGAGILPGPPGEFGVAILPEERVSSPTSQNHGPNSEPLLSESGFEILPEERRQQSLPSHDDDPLFATKTGDLPTGGVGTLPGNKEEFGVALLPEERNPRAGSECGASTDASTRSLHGDTSQYTLPATGSASLAPGLASTPDKNTTAISTCASHPVIPNTTARTYPLASDGVKFKGAPLSKGFQKGLDEEQLSPTEGQSNVATAGHGAVSPAIGGLGSHAGQEAIRKKPGFMDKLKGEVKVISGKLSHKEDMVEKGKRMMGKN